MNELTVVDEPEFSGLLSVITFAKIGASFRDSECVDKVSRTNNTISVNNGTPSCCFIAASSLADGQVNVMEFIFQPSLTARPEPLRIISVGSRLLLLPKNATYILFSGGCLIELWIWWGRGT